MSAMNKKIALVTGASRGIGQAIALRLAQAGNTVIVHFSTNREAADEVVGRIERNGGASFSVQSDLGSVADIARLFKGIESELVRRYGEAYLDILVNNAGIVTRSRLEETSEEQFDRVFAVNVRGPFFMVQHALPLLRDNGRIINLSSIVTRLASPEVAAYAMTKGAINTMTHLLAMQLGPRGITVNAVAPGATDTDMNATWLRSPEGRQTVIKATAMGRVGLPADIAAVVAFLASPDGGWVTGQCIEASGGVRL
jgi:NAD(P)-dependent dehydrogenase (short-subunit alcohol dehydrogenase family)